jgi:hypothetical protein
MTLLLPAPRAIPRECSIQIQSQRRVGAVLTILGIVTIVGFACASPVMALIPHCWVLLIAGIWNTVAAHRKEQLMRSGVESLADVRVGKGITLAWSTHEQQIGAVVLLYEEGRARILVDPVQPGRMIPVTLEMIPLPALVASVGEIACRLPTTPRSGGPRLMRESGGRVRTSMALVALAAGMAIVMGSMAAVREQFLAAATRVSGRVVAIDGANVLYEADGLRGQYRKGKSAPKVGAVMFAWKRDGRVMTESELPGIAWPPAVVLPFMLALAGLVLLVASVIDLREARRLWSQGVEVDGRIVSRHVADGTEEVVYRFASRGLRGVGRRVFRSDRHPMAAGDPFKVVIVCDPKDEKRSRIVLLDEVLDLP